jgi:hypothetical protein
MDVEVDDIERQIIVAVPARDVLDLLGGVVAVAALLVPERPGGPQRHPPGQLGVPIEHLLHRRAPEDVLVELAPLGLVAEVRTPAGEVEAAPVGVVEEDPVHLAALPRQVEGHALIGGIGAVAVLEGVAVPHREAAATLVEVRGLHAQAIDVLVEAQPSHDLHPTRADPQRGGVAADERVGVGLAQLDREVGARDAHLQLGGGDGDRGRVLADVDACWRPLAAEPARSRAARHRRACAS